MQTFLWHPLTPKWLSQNKSRKTLRKYWENFFRNYAPFYIQGVDIFMEITVQVGECIVRKGIRANEKKTKPETSKLLVLKHHLQVINIQLRDDNSRSSCTFKLSHVCQESLARREPYLESGEIQWARLVVEDLVWETACFYW